MWLQHLWNLIVCSWDATVTGYGTTTLGFILWTVLFTVLGWFASVAATWIKLRKRNTPHPFREAFRDSLLTGLLVALTMMLILGASYGFFFVRTIYWDHVSLVAQNAALIREKSTLQEQLETRKHSMVTTDPVFGNTIYLLQAFNSYRHAQNGKPCVLLLSAPAGVSQGGAMASMVAQFSNSVSGCFTFGPMDANADPDVEKRAETGMVPDKIVFHAERGNHAAEQLFIGLSNLIQLKRSYDTPTAAEKSHLYRIPKAGQEDVIWLQFGTNVKWNEQLQ